jgi:hypothetical protein
MLRALTVLLFAVYASPAQAQERQWQLNAADEDVYLVFGVPDTNDVGVSFWCKIGKKDVSLFAPIPAAPGEKQLDIAIKIGADDFKLAGTVGGDADQTSIEAKLEPRDRILGDLQSNERFTVTIAEHAVTYPLDGADIPGMLKLCDQLPEVQN